MPSGTGRDVPPRTGVAATGGGGVGERDSGRTSEKSVAVGAGWVGSFDDCAGAASGIAGRVVGEAATAQDGYDPATHEIELTRGRENAVTVMLAPDVRGRCTVEIELQDVATDVRLATTGPKEVDLAH